ncbi:surface lipoprotein assembly modifier [Arcobacter sp. YIC-310]|uniref:surface lipoprotein assembly modifier n=1 Tax=Arcobacter sp. YIC-310 TaxID=3376632 RepID=UPI003C1675EC
MINKLICSSFTATVFLSMPLVAQYKQEKIGINNVYKAQYSKALKAFKNKNYDKSFKEFNLLFQNNLDNILINYYLGRSAYELGKYEFAISAYDRILIQEPNNSKVRLELAQSYLQMALWGQALEEFKKASKGNLPAVISKKVEKTIAILQNKQKRSQVSAYFISSIIYDSNVNNTSLNDIFNIYSPNLGSNIRVSTNAQEESTTIFHNVFNLNHKYKIEDDTILDTNISFVNRKYKNFKDKDLHVISLNTKPVFFSKNYKTSFAFNIDKVFLGHKPYQLNYYLTPSYTQSISNNVLFSTSLRVGRTNYHSEKYKDAKVYDFNTIFKYLNEDYGLFTFGINSGRENEVSEDRTDISNSYSRIYLSNSYEFLDDYVLTSSASFKMTNYRDYDLNFQNKREDKERDFSLSLEKRINNSFTVNAGSSYEKRESNQEPSEYNKYTLNLGAFISF